LAIVLRLREAYPHKRFTLDGRLVGDIGEILVEEAYEVALFTDQQAFHDGQDSQGRNIQIKATMRDTLTFPVESVPDYYIGIHVHEDGTFDEIFNGPGEIAAISVAGRAKPPKNNLHGVSLSALAKLSKGVSSEQRIPRRQRAEVQPEQPAETHLEAIVAPTS
jgi:hypothetical protein